MSFYIMSEFIAEALYLVYGNGKLTKTLAAGLVIIAFIS